MKLKAGHRIRHMYFHNKININDYLILNIDKYFLRLIKLDGSSNILEVLSREYCEAAYEIRK